MYSRGIHASQRRSLSATTHSYAHDFHQYVSLCHLSFRSSRNLQSAPPLSLLQRPLLRRSSLYTHTHTYYCIYDYIKPENCIIKPLTSGLLPAQFVVLYNLQIPEEGDTINLRNVEFNYGVSLLKQFNKNPNLMVVNGHQLQSTTLRLMQ